MYFKVDQGSEVYGRLSAVHEKREHCREQARNLVNEVGGLDYVVRYDHAGGGVGGIKFDQKPEGWKKLDYGTYIFYPKSIPANRQLLKRIADLPVLTVDELNETVGFKKQTITFESGGFGQIRSIGVYFGTDFHLVYIQRGCKFKPLEGMEEVTCSEFDRLKKTLPNFQEVPE